MNQQRSLSAALATLVIAILLVACSSGADSGAPTTGEPESNSTEQAPTTAAVPTEGDEDAGNEVAELKLGISHLSGAFMATYVADEMGFFADHGLDVEVIPFTGGPLAVQALVAGEIDVFEGDFTPVLNTFDLDEADLVVFAETNSWAFYELQSMEESVEAMLESNPVGGVSAIGGIDHIIAQYMLRELGYDLGQVEFRVAGPPAERAQAMLAQQVGFIAGAPPGRYTVEQSGGNTLASLDEVLDSLPVENFATTRAYFEANQDLLKKLVAAQQDASEWVRSNPEETTDIVMAAVNATEEDRPNWARMVEENGPWLGGLTAPALEERSFDGYAMLIDFYIEEGTLQGVTREEVMENLLVELE